MKRAVDPLDGQLYLEFGNEVWNYAWPFFLNSSYAEGIGEGNVRRGYGLLVARMIDAVDRTGLGVTYVVASQTAAPESTGIALEAIRAAGVDMSRIKLALTSYHGGPDAYREIVTQEAGESLVAAWEREILLDPEGLKQRLHHRYTMTDALFSKRWIVDRWAEHVSIADVYGVKLLGAYEGGSHDTPPNELATSQVFLDWWTDYHWGSVGADVVRQVNQAIIDRYPGVMLSNFDGRGRIGQPALPWIDGAPGAVNPMIEVWDGLARGRAGNL